MFSELELSALRYVAGLLNREGIEWANTGGVALSLWGHPRTGTDVEFLIGVDDRDVEDILAALQAAGLQSKRVPPVMTVAKQRFVQYLFRPPEENTEFQVDFLFAEQPFQRQAISGRLLKTIPEGDLKLFVPACEDLIVFKLAAGRLIDLAEAAALLQVNRSVIDFPSLRSACTQLDLKAAMYQVWNDAFPDATLPGAGA